MKAFLKLFTVSGVVMVVLVLPTITHAQTLSKVSITRGEMISQELQDLRRDRQASREARTEERIEILEDRCELITDRIQLQTSRYDNNNTLFLKWNEQMIRLTEKFILKADKSELDTTAVKANLEVFKNKAHATEQLYAEYVIALKEAQAYACGKSDGAFKQELSEARQLLQNVRESMLDLRSYYQTELRPEIKALKSQNSAE